VETSERENWVFTGTAKGMTLDQAASLDSLLTRIQPATLRHGDCIGADATADARARYRVSDIRILRHPATSQRRAWCTSPLVTAPRPALVRNVVMVTETAASGNARCVATPYEDHEVLRSGTWATCRDASKADVPVTVIWPDGRIEHGWKPDPKVVSRNG
jgi:hypothetical protein